MTVASQAIRERGTPEVFSAGSMTPALTPAHALAYLRELSADLRGGVVLSSAGVHLAGDATLLTPARALLAAAGGAAEAEGRTRRGAAFVARSGDVVVVIASGPQTIAGLARHDLRLVLGDLGAPVPGESSPANLPPEVVDALISAARRGPGE